MALSDLRGITKMQLQPNLIEIASLVDLAVERHGSLDRMDPLGVARALMNAAIERVEKRIASGQEVLLDLSNEMHREAMAEALALFVAWLFDGVREVPSHETLVSAALAELGAS